MANLGVLGACGPLPWQARLRVHHVGWLVNVQIAGAESFWLELRERGYTEGHNLAVERRWSARADLADLDSLATELSRAPRRRDRRVEHARCVAAKRATSTIPIVFTSIADPVGSGLVFEPRAARQQCHRAVGHWRHAE